MSLQLELKGWQIALLEWQAENLKDGSIHVPSHVRWSLGGMGPIAYIERERYRRKREYKRAMRRLAYLKEQQYLERVKEHERILYKLTSKGKYELLRLQFVLHMYAAQEKPWNSKFCIIIFDIPEEKKKYRDFMRKLLKRNGFKMLQLSVWMTRYDPRPVLTLLLKYLHIEQYCEIIEIDCKACSRRLQKKIQ